MKKRPELPTDGTREVSTAPAVEFYNDKCGAFGCTLPRGHNRGKADVPSNHNIPVIPTARFSQFPFDLVARYVNHKVEFTVEKLTAGTGKELETPWIVRKLT